MALSWRLAVFLAVALIASLAATAFLLRAARPYDVTEARAWLRGMRPQRVELPAPPASPDLLVSHETV